MADAERATFKQETITKILQQHFTDQKTKLSGDAAKLATEVLRVFITEASTRAANRAQSEGGSEVTTEHFEKVLPQLLLDF